MMILIISIIITKLISSRVYFIELDIDIIFSIPLGGFGGDMVGGIGYIDHFWFVGVFDIDGVEGGIGFVIDYG